MWPLIVAIEYIGGGVAIVMLGEPGAVIAAVCVADIVMKTIRNSMIDQQVNALVSRYQASFGAHQQAADLTEAARIGGFAAGGTVGEGIGMILGMAANAFWNAKLEKQMGPEQRALHQEIRRVAGTKSSYRLTFSLFSWLAIVWGGQWFLAQFLSGMKR
jgi:hypothetical protein